MRINPARPQFLPVLWGCVCLFGLAVAIQKLFEFPYLSPGWQGGVGLIVLVVFGFGAIEGWWLASQREITISENGLTIRSWLQIVFGRTGISIRWSELYAAALIFDNGRKLELRTNSGRLLFWAALWDPVSVNELLQTFREKDIDTRMEWTPGR